MKYRKLRIAWSVVWGVVAVVFITLWVWSYRYPGNFFSMNGRGYSFDGGTHLTAHGPLFYIGLRDGRASIVYVPDYTIYEAAIEGGARVNTIVSLRGVRFDRQPGGGWSFDLPHWLLVTCSTILAVLPWSRFRFSLRTLLIATTVVAVVLGLVVWVS